MVEGLINQLFSSKVTSVEEVNYNIGKLQPRQAASKTESLVKRQKIADLKLSTPEIFKEKKLIGEGTFGKVYRAKIGDKLYALKKIKVEALTDDGFPITSIREIKVLKKLEEHPNIVQLVDIVRSKN